MMLKMAAAARSRLRSVIRMKNVMRSVMRKMPRASLKLKMNANTKPRAETAIKADGRLIARRADEAPIAAR